MASDMIGITSNVISGGQSSSMSLRISLVMLLIIIVLAAYLIYKHHKRRQNEASAQKNTRTSVYISGR